MTAAARSRRSRRRARRAAARPPQRPPARAAGACWVYMLRCGDGSLYTGAAKDLGARLRQHQAGRASRYTRAHLPVELAWSRACATWSEALRRESRIKRLRRAQKEALVAGAALPQPAGSRR